MPTLHDRARHKKNACRLPSGARRHLCPNTSMLKPVWIQRENMHQLTSKSKWICPSNPLLLLCSSKIPGNSKQLYIIFYLSLQASPTEFLVWSLERPAVTNPPDLLGPFERACGQGLNLWKSVVAMFAILLLHGIHTKWRNSEGSSRF